MVRFVKMVGLGTLLLVSPATAQHSDLGAANLDAAGSIAGGIAMGSYTENENGSRSARSSYRARAARAAATCANLPRVRARLGADNRLARACRQAGF